MKLLVLAPEPIDAAALRDAAGEEALEAEVLVISPATTHSGLRFWMSDADEAIGHAQESADQTAELLEEDGVDAVSETGESEPAVAVQDALATFKADRVVVFTHTEGELDYREDEGLKELGVPVTFAEIGKPRT